MQYEVSLGRTKRPPVGNARFRLVLLGDFSGRAAAGTVEIGAALATRRPLRVDVDSLDDVLARFELRLTLALDGEDVVEVPINSMDDFHPDQLVENVPFLERLVGLRRSLNNRAGFDRAAKEVLSWSGAEALPPPARARADAVPTDRRLSDFSRLTGRPASRGDAEGSVDALLRRIVGPHVEPKRDARQEQLTARVDDALAEAMRRVLHHPQFQAVEAAWRGVELLVRRLETGARLEIVLLDISAEEFAADLASTDELERCGLYDLLVEQPRLDSNQGPFSALLALYDFELTPPHADLLGRAAQIAAAAGAPLVAGTSPDPLRTPPHEQHPLVREAWSALQALPASAYLGVASPRFLLRMPYGKRSDPIDAFPFEEFTRQSGLSGMLWGHPALAAGLLLAETWQRQGNKMKPGAGPLTIPDMPYYVYKDTDGEQVALPCTERLWGERQAAQAGIHRVIPLLCLRGRPELRLGGFASLAGTPLAGFWAPMPMPATVPADAPFGKASTGAAHDPVSPEPTPADVDLDALLASIDAPMAAAEPTLSADIGPEATAPVDIEAVDDLDALLASLNAPPATVDADATDPDLDALLASL